jgi:hypothetical protein
MHPYLVWKYSPPFFMLHHYRVHLLAIQSLFSPLIHQLIRVYYMSILYLNISAYLGLSTMIIALIIYQARLCSEVCYCLLYHEEV